jgi:hypothetical protein
MKTKKEIKEAYKLLKFKIGLLRIKNAVNGKIFIEGSCDLDSACNKHNFALRLGGHPNSELQTDWNLHSAENFKFDILEELEQKKSDTLDYTKEIRLLEEMYLEDLQPYDEKGYHRRKKN